MHVRNDSTLSFSTERERERQKKVTLTTDMTIPLVEEVYKDYSTVVVVLNRENRRGRSVRVVFGNKIVINLSIVILNSTRPGKLCQSNRFRPWVTNERTNRTTCTVRLMMCVCCVCE